MKSFKQFFMLVFLEIFAIISGLSVNAQEAPSLSFEAEYGAGKIICTYECYSRCYT